MTGEGVLLAQAAGVAYRPQVPDDSIRHQLWALLQVLMQSTFRNRILWIGVAVAAVIIANTVGQVRLNVWQGDFYDALEQRHVSAFMGQLIVFGVVVGGLLTLIVLETWLRQMLEVRLREWLTKDLLDQWLQPRRAYFLAFDGEIGANPDQRLQADCQHFVELTADLGIGLIRSGLLLFSFVGVLWLLSAQIHFEIGARTITVPGYFVWTALAFALSGSLLTWWVGRPLVALDAERYAREARLRSALARINDHAEGIALNRGEADERRALDRPVDDVIEIMRRLASRLARLTWITSGFGWLGLVMPILVAAPGYFQGSISFGTLMMVVGAFTQVGLALRWFVDNFSRIAEWRAALLRIVCFREIVVTIETMGDDLSRIERVEQLDGPLTIENLHLALIDGKAAIEEPLVTIPKGQRVTITGEPGTGKSTLFRALAGLWPWGSGVIKIPAGALMMFLPQRPHLPLGRLRDALTYPAPRGSFDAPTLETALQQVDLGYLAPKLDSEERWDRSLSLSEQQRLAFARVLLHRPDYVVIDNALTGLEDEERQLLRALFEGALAGLTVINIGSGNSGNRFRDQMLHLRRVPDGKRFRRPSERFGLTPATGAAGAVTGR